MNITEKNLPKPVRPKDPDDGRPVFDDLWDVVSGMECTGLIPSAPVDDYEIGSYSQIYDIPLSADQSSGRPTDREPTAKQDGTARGKSGKTQIS